MQHRAARDHAAKAISRALQGTPIDSDPIANMHAFVETAWEPLHDAGISWLGFYLAPGHTHKGATAAPDEMIMGPSCPVPACSPIALHGACGRALREQRTLIINNVANLGDGYVACDPRDQSELVIPILTNEGHPFAVYDADSYAQGAFGTEDLAQLKDLLAAAGLRTPPQDAHLVI